MPREPQDCLILSFGRGGHAEHYRPIGDTTSTLSGYDSPDNWKPENLVNYSGCIVIDKREAVGQTAGFNHVFRGPMVDCRLSGMEADMLPGRTEPGGLDYVSPARYAAGWQAVGARIGRIESGAIVWE